jgi:hypothetical protein
MRAHSRLIGGLVAGLMFVSLILEPSPAQENKKEPKGASVRELAEARLDAARKACQAMALEYLEGKATLEQCNQWSRRWMDAQRDVLNRRANLVSSAEEHLLRMQQLEKVAQERVDKKRAQPSEAYIAEYLRVEAEQNVARVKSAR